VSWRIDANRALDAWEPGQPVSRIEAVHAWLLERSEAGPSSGAISAPWDEDLFVDRIPAADLIVTFLAVAQDQYIVIKSFQDL